MKNLKLSTEISVSLDLVSDDEHLLFSAIDIERNRIFFASSSNLIYTAHFPSPQNAKVESGVILPAEVQPLDLEIKDVITSFEYLMEKEALIIGTSSGLLLLYMVDCNVMETVGGVEGGVKCISSSPDGDLLAVTTGLGQLLVMTHDWDVLYETAFEDHLEDLDVSELAKSSPAYSCGSLISWRGDGKFFATLSKVQGSCNLRKIKVWERDSGLLHSSSNPIVLNSEALEWMPSGAKIATVCDKKKENMCPSITFFERNGLERSSFSINEPSDAVVEVLKWNSSSELLAALVKCAKHYSVKIWSFSNNHWYLKQEIRYSKQDRLQLMWDPTKPFQLICWSSRGHISVYNFNWITAVMENSVALVVDGSNIAVTPLSLSLIPPPMFLFKLKFPSAVREIAFFSESLRILLAAFLSDGNLCIIELPSPSSWEELEGKEFDIEASCSETYISSLLHLQWLDSDILLGASHVGFHHTKCCSPVSSENNDNLGYRLMQMEVLCSENHISKSVIGSGWNVKISNQMLVEKLVISIASNPAKRGSAFVQLNGGDVFVYVSEASISKSASNPHFLKYDTVVLSSSCPWMTVASVSRDNEKIPFLFGLNEHGVLHADGRILCNNCNTFSIYSDSSDQVMTHLILSTKQDLLYIIDIADVLDGTAELKFENFLHVASKRKEDDKNFINIWERGAKIIGVLHGDQAAVILQTIRGNLECIHPRKLVLTSISNALVQGRFKDALLMVRRHRIDFNFMVDYFGWKSFCPFASDFVRQVNNLSYITEFVCAIKNENTTEKLYKNYIALPSSEDVKDVCAGVGDADSSSKLSSVLLSLRRALEEQVTESSARELCILTTLARSDPPALEEALARIKVTRDLELSGSIDPRRTSYPSAEEALKHLLWLSDSDAVFEAALGLYDLNLAAIVALNAQKDPKEFLPFLQELESMSTLLMQYKIDLYLRRYEKALKHIVAVGEVHHPDCMALLKDQPQLFPVGLQLCTDLAKRRQIYEAWGDYLTDEKKFEEAAAAFLSGGCLEKALRAYRACGLWGGVMTVAGLLNLGEEEVLEMANELREELQALGKPGEAAKIALQYCADVESAVSLLISAREWEEALRISFLHRSNNLIQEVKNASLECAGIVISEYEEGIEKIGKYLTRYLAVRQRRLLLAAKLRSEEHSVNDIDDETVSQSSSNFSGMSAYTTGTRRSSAASVSSSATSRAKETKRKKNRGKIRAGSPGEELALVEHLKGMAVTSSAKHELKVLLSALLMLGMEETASKVQHIAELFQFYHMAAIRLADDSIPTDIRDDRVYALDRYIKIVKREENDSEAFSWRCKILISP